jgi:hypothetical protein
MIKKKITTIKRTTENAEIVEYEDSPSPLSSPIKGEEIINYSGTKEIYWM